MDIVKVDFVVVGCGLAGSAAAYGLSSLGDVALVSKSTVTGTNSYAAQGGVAAAVADTDTPESHYSDTLGAGAGLCDATAVFLLVRRAPELLQWLFELGVPFDKNPSGSLSLGLEGAHSHPRIVHAGGDATGRHIMETLTTRISMCPTVQSFNNMHVTKLVKDARDRVIGVLGVKSNYPSNSTLWLAKRAVILATGGAGQLYRYTTNPTEATGDGIALAFEAGAEVRNMEFVQFHPTVLLQPNHSSLLISEAVRGAGARLVDVQRIPIMERHSDDLGARDVVARAIYKHSQESGPVFLDTTLIPGFEKRFPTIYAGCVARGLDPTVSPIPVFPAAHFLMGGISANMSGKTSLKGLYAIGETACTGVHGANRLASNSLLECLVTAFQLTRHMATEATSLASSPEDLLAQVDDTSEFRPNTRDILEQVRGILWESCGIVRNQRGLLQGLNSLAELETHATLSPAVSTATLIAASALARQETRGSHYRSDYPATDTTLAHDSIVSKANFSITKLATASL